MKNKTLSSALYVKVLAVSVAFLCMPAAAPVGVLLSFIVMTCLFVSAWRELSREVSVPMIEIMEMGIDHRNSLRAERAA